MGKLWPGLLMVGPKTPLWPSGGLLTSSLYGLLHKSTIYLKSTFPHLFSSVYHILQHECVYGAYHTSILHWLMLYQYW